MLCIAAFVVLLVLGAVSAKYRVLLRRAWSCVARRATFRPCESTFREEITTALLAPVAVRTPRLVRPAGIAIEVTAWVMVLSLVVSGYLVARSGLNLLAYGTCNKQNPAACSLSAQGCSIEGQEPSFGASLRKGDVIGAFGDEFGQFAESVAAVPGRFRTWDATQYLPAAPSYLGGYREGLPTAVEVIDPGCRYCAELFRNLEEASFAEANNLTYLVYPIGPWYAPKFANSPLVARYLTAIRIQESANGSPAQDPTDWFVLEQIFTATREDGVLWQTWLNETATADQAETQLQSWLTEAGYGEAEVAQVDELAASDEVERAVADGRVVVEREIATVTIPTLIAGGDRLAGVVGVEKLRGIG